MAHFALRLGTHLVWPCNQALSIIAREKWRCWLTSPTEVRIDVRYTTYHVRTKP